MLEQRLEHRYVGIVFLNEAATLTSSLGAPSRLSATYRKSLFPDFLLKSAVLDKERLLRYHLIILYQNENRCQCR